MTGAVLTLGGALALRAQAPAAPAGPPQKVDFLSDIRPILEKHCFECHGPSKARGQLRLHTGALLRKGGASGAPIEPGHAEQSLLYRRVMGLDADDQMPLDRDPLPAETLALVKAWIDQGAQLPAADPTHRFRRARGAGTLGVRQTGAAGRAGSALESWPRNADRSLRARRARAQTR